MSESKKKSTKPRICSNRLTVDGPADQIPQFYDSIRTIPGSETHYGEWEGIIDFHRVIPVEVPADLYEKLQVPESQKVNVWNPLNWLSPEAFVDPLLAYQSDAWATNNAFASKKIDDTSFWFDTLRLPPVPVLKKLSQSWPDIKFTLEYKYQDPESAGILVGKLFLHQEAGISERVNYTEEEREKEAAKKDAAEIILERLKRPDQPEEPPTPEPLPIENIDPNDVEFDAAGQPIWKNQPPAAKAPASGTEGENLTTGETSGEAANVADGNQSGPAQPNEPIQIPLFEAPSKCIIA